MHTGIDSWFLRSAAAAFICVASPSLAAEIGSPAARRPARAPSVLEKGYRGTGSVSQQSVSIPDAFIQRLANKNKPAPAPAADPAQAPAPAAKAAQVVKVSAAVDVSPAFAKIEAAETNAAAQVTASDVLDALRFLNEDEAKANVVTVTAFKTNIVDVTTFKTNVIGVTAFKTNVVDVTAFKTNVIGVTAFRTNVVDVTAFKTNVVDVTAFRTNVVDVTAFKTNVIGVTAFRTNVIDITAFKTNVVDVTAFKTNVVDVTAFKTNVVDVVAFKTNVVDVTAFKTNIVDVTAFKTNVVGVTLIKTNVVESVKAEPEPVVEPGPEAKAAVSGRSSATDAALASPTNLVRKLKGRPANITSRSLFHDRKEGVLFLDRNVHVDDEQYQLWANKAYVFMEGTNDVKRIVAIGDVALTNEMRRAYGSKISYYKDGGMVVLYGWPDRPAEIRDEAKAEAQVVKGRKIKFWIDSEQVEVIEADITAPSSGMSGGGLKKAIGR